jgi:hypothetical protein
MLATSQSRSSVLATSGPIHQLYITHCLHDEGIFRQAGFAPRASSTRDPLQLRFAQEYPPYELPGGMLSGEVSRATAPRRLALVRLPGGQKALVHSVYLPGEHLGRANNFFSHVLVSPSLAPREALQLWASPDWATDYPPGADKDLPPLTALPATGPLTDRALTAFLSNKDELDPGPLNLPVRLAADSKRRRELLSLTLRAGLLVLRSEPWAEQGRFFLLAEPELAALLLYGAIRLLPPHLVAEMTFSTYEPLRHVLRGQCPTPFIALSPGPADPEPSEELFKTRGLFLDTFRPRCSDQLREQADPAVDEWIDLAGQGEWKILDKVYGLLGNTGAGVVSFRQGLQAAKMARRLTAGKAEPADLLALKRSEWGPGLLEQHGDKIWPLVREATLRDPLISEAYADMLAAHVPELEQDLAEALRTPSSDLRRSCQLLHAALRNDLGRLRDIFQRVLPSPPFSAALRFSILREVDGLQVYPVSQPFPLQALLRQCSTEELEQFARSGLPHEWFTWALCYAIVRPETQADAARHLLGGDDTLLRIFWEQFKLLKDEKQRRAILGPLLVARDDRAVLFFSRSLKVLPSLRLETLEWVLETLGALGPQWNDFWCSEDHLARLLDLLRNLGDDAQRLWDQLHANIDPHGLLLGEAGQRAFVLNLAAARDRPGLTLPGWADQTVADWVLLTEHFERASAVPESDRAAIVGACKRRGVDAIAVLRRYFERFVLPREPSAELLADFAGFFDSFYLPGNDYQDIGSRFLGWNEVVRVCPDEARGQVYRRYYLDHCVEPVYRDRLAEEVLGDKGARSLPTPTPAPMSRADAGSACDSFVLCGVRRSESPLAALGQAAPWLLCSFAGGLLAAAVFGTIKVPPRQLALLCCFLPLILAMAESTVLQHLAVGHISTCGRGVMWNMLAGLGLALLGGGLAAGAALAWGTPIGAVLSVGGAVAGGMLGATILGLLLPRLLRRSRLKKRLAVGPIARALAGLGALAIYVLLAGWFVR